MIASRLSNLATRADYLEASEERTLLQRAKGGEQGARDRLVLSHMRLAIAGAMQFRHHGYSVDDLTHEGVAGLLSAIDAFDLSVESRFSTYARWWIRARLSDYVLRYAGPLAFSTTLAGKAMFFRLRAERSRLEAEGRLDRAAIEHRLAEIFGVPVDRIRTASAFLANTAGVPLNEPIIPGGEERGAILADDAEGQDDRAEAAIDGERRQSVLQTALGRLDPRSRAIVTARYMAEEGCETLEVLAQRFGVSRERVRQIEVKALAKLKTLLNADGTARQGVFAT